MIKIYLSVVVLTKNEEKSLEKCLKSLVFCDEIIIIDDFSTDKTIEIAKSYKAIIYKRALDGDFSAQRNFGIEKSRGEWVLFIDADEEVTTDLKNEIRSVVIPSERSESRDHNIVAFYLKRRDWFWGREMKYGETKKVRNEGLIRLVKKDAGKWVGKVHEQFKIKNEKFKIKRLNYYINHYPHATVKDFLKEINSYSTLKAKELFENNKKTNIFEIIFFPFGKFLLNYFIYLGFLDGPSGFAYAFFMSFHSFLVRAKLYQYKRIIK